ncbi:MULTISPECIES: hypothetical protein [unclassified Microcoleus]|uniref:hypothetical protein n=1 Tax=unclassified Microcoleus TaxID=2642155 RepID=UPI002FD68730
MDASSNRLATGKMPVPQKFNILVERASCPFPKNSTFILVERARCPFPKNSTFLWNGHLARSQKIQYSCGMGILPVPKKFNILVERASCPFL